MFDGIESEWSGEPAPKRPGPRFTKDEAVGALFTLAGVGVCAAMANLEMEIIKVAVGAVSGPYGIAGAARVTGLGSALAAGFFGFGVQLAGLEKSLRASPTLDPS